MRKTILIFVAMTLIAFAYMSTSVLAEEGMKDPMVTIQEDVGLFWVSKEVRNTQSEKLGTVKDFVRDSEGKVSFAIVGHGGFLGFGEKKVAVPYSALTYDKDKEYFTCAISKDRFAAAPEFVSEEELHDRSFAEEVYRYFGQHPYWTDELMGEPGKMESKGMEDSMGSGAWDYY